MITIRLNERPVELRDFRVRWSYEGYLAGSREKISACIRESLRDDIHKLMWDCGATHIIDDGRPVLPEYTCMAYLQAAPLSDDSDFSQLLLCWFVESPSGNLKELVGNALQGMEWKEFAGPGCY